MGARGGGRPRAASRGGVGRAALVAGRRRPGVVLAGSRTCWRGSGRPRRGLASASFVATGDALGGCGRGRDRRPPLHPGPCSEMLTGFYEPRGVLGGQRRPSGRERPPSGAGGFGRSRPPVPLVGDLLRSPPDRAHGRALGAAVLASRDRGGPVVRRRGPAATSPRPPAPRDCWASASLSGARGRGRVAVAVAGDAAPRRPLPPGPRSRLALAGDRAGGAALAASRRGASRSRGRGGVAAWNLWRSPRPPSRRMAAGRPARRPARVVAERPGSGRRSVVGVPTYKSTAALVYPLTVLGHPRAPAADATRVTVLCDALFEEVVSLACLGPAEAARLRRGGGQCPGSLVHPVRGGAGPLDLLSTRSPAADAWRDHAVPRGPTGERANAGARVRRRSLSPRPGRGGRSRGGSCDWRYGLPGISRTSMGAGRTVETRRSVERTDDGGHGPDAWRGTGRSGRPGRGTGATGRAYRRMRTAR